MEVVLGGGGWSRSGTLGPVRGEVEMERLGPREGQAQGCAEGRGGQAVGARSVGLRALGGLGLSQCPVAGVVHQAGASEVCMRGWRPWAGRGRLLHMRLGECGGPS